MAEGLSAIEVTSLATRFYESGSSALLEYGGLLGQIAGDEVMALFVPGLATDAYRSKAVQAGQALLKALGYGSSERTWVEAGVGIASGEEFVGNVMGGGYKDFTALGNVTNTAARLTSIARGGEIIVDTETYAAVAELYPEAEPRELELKGKRAPVKSYTIQAE